MLRASDDGSVLHDLCESCAFVSKMPSMSQVQILRESTFRRSGLGRKFAPITDGEHVTYSAQNFFASLSTPQTQQICVEDCGYIL